MKNKSERSHPDTLAGGNAMVSAIFGAVAGFAESPKEKLEAVVRAGTIAESFLSGASEGISPSVPDIKVFRRKRPKAKGSLADRAA